ncbi:MAG TPA: DMT family transporter [Candidatus Cybelea sp.]|nr:DMT family transporter [Candidatus Cybelea sp.]
MTQTTAESPARAAPSALRNQPGRAVRYMLTQAFLLTAMDGLVKWLAIGNGGSQPYSVGQIAFLRYSLGLCMMIGMAWGSGEGLGSLRTRRLRGHLIRSCCNLFTMLSFYLALKLVPLPNAICIALASPIFVTILSIPMLKEHVGIRRWSAVAVGFLGIVLIAQPTAKGINLESLLALFTDPGAAGPQWGSILALLSAAAWAATQVSSRQLSTSEPSHRILFYYSLVVVVVLGVAMPFYWITPSWHDVLLFVAIGLMGTAGQFCLNQAFRYGEASLVAPLDYTGLIWATIIGWIFWNDKPTLTMTLGAAIVVASCIYINQRGARKKRGS